MDLQSEKTEVSRYCLRSDLINKKGWRTSQGADGHHAVETALCRRPPLAQYDLGVGQFFVGKELMTDWQFWIEILRKTYFLIFFLNFSRESF
jgi:hypothetical protein